MPYVLGAAHLVFQVLLYTYLTHSVANKLACTTTAQYHHSKGRAVNKRENVRDEEIEME